MFIDFLCYFLDWWLSSLFSPLFLASCLLEGSSLSQQPKRIGKNIRFYFSFSNLFDVDFDVVFVQTSKAFALSYPLRRLYSLYVHTNTQTHAFSTHRDWARKRTALSSSDQYVTRMASLLVSRPTDRPAVSSLFILFSTSHYFSCFPTQPPVSRLLYCSTIPSTHF